MGITTNQNLPEKPKPEAESWTVRKLFPMLSAVASFAKVANPLEMMAAFMVIVSGIGELLNRNLSLPWYLVLCLILGGNFYLHYKQKLPRKK